MKKAVIGLVVLFGLAAGVAMANQDKKWTETPSGSFRVDRFWEETVGNYTCSYTIISYKNTTNKTFSQVVKLKASVFDKADNLINMNTRSFFAHEYGPIEPGFEGTVKIPVECSKGQANQVSVKIEIAR